MEQEATTPPFGHPSLAGGESERLPVNLVTLRSQCRSGCR